MKRDDGMFSMHVAYLVNQYPKVSHSFIRREIQAVERQGVTVTRFSVRGWQDQLVDADDLRERDKTRYILQGGVFPLLISLLASALTTPGKFLDALVLALHMGRRAEKPWPYHLVYLAEACHLVPWLKEGDVQLIHAHFGTNAAEVAMLANVLCGIPYSMTIHGSEEFDKPEYIGLKEKIAGAAFVVAISSYCRSQVLRWTESAQWPKVNVVHCGLEPNFYDVPAQAPPQHPRLVCVGRLCEQKGQLLLIEAAASLVRQGIDFELVLAGDGEMRPDVEAAIAKHGLSRHVHITGWISGDQVRDEILAARALVISSFAEGLPVVVMEAMALRRPVLATLITGIPELVVSGENGWLFLAGSMEELAAAMIRCLETSLEDLSTMGEKARKRVLVRHDIDTEAIKLVSLFHGVISPQAQMGKMA